MHRYFHNEQVFYLWNKKVFLLKGKKKKTDRRRKGWWRGTSENISSFVGLCFVFYRFSGGGCECDFAFLRSVDMNELALVESLPWALPFLPPLWAAPKHSMDQTLTVHWQMGVLIDEKLALSLFCTWQGRLWAQEPLTGRHSGNEVFMRCFSDTLVKPVSCFESLRLLDGKDGGTCSQACLHPNAGIA